VPGEEIQKETEAAAGGGNGFALQNASVSPGSGSKMSCNISS